jgi:aspartate kinase
MAVIVQKYGGSSVADVEKIRKVADKVVATARAGNQVVVVVSAMGKTTDSLLSLAREAATVPDAPASPPRRELDMLVTTGERVSMALLSIAIHARGLDAISFTGSQCGIMTNDRHFDARIIEVRPIRVEDELARGRIVIVAGYQGVSYKREITTLGRGGSDTTAVALAAALDADRCEIYSDVDGVYSADPRVVPDAVHIPEMDHAMLQEMAESGAKVLNAQAVEWARRSGIAIYARASFGPSRPDGEPERQTVVRKFAATEENRARAIVGETNAALVRIDGAGAIEAARTASALQALDIPMRDLTLTDRGGSFVVPLSNVPEWDRTRRRMSELAGLQGASIEQGVAVVSVVGAGLSETAEPLHRMVSALERAGVRPRELGASPLRLRAVVDGPAAGQAQRALHAAFMTQ